MTHASRLRRAIRRRVGRAARAEGGSATIEFVLIFPVFLTFMLSSFEVGMLMTRQVSLDRGLDLAVRDLRLGAFDDEFDAMRAQNASPAALAAAMHARIVTAVCDGAPLIADCAGSLKLEMVSADARAWTPLPAVPDCVDSRDPGLPVREFDPGEQNQLMLLRACSLFTPMFPSSGLGFDWSDRQGQYALTATTSYVIEPNRDRT